MHARIECKLRNTTYAVHSHIAFFLSLAHGSAAARKRGTNKSPCPSAPHMELCSCGTDHQASLLPWSLHLYRRPSPPRRDHRQFQRLPSCKQIKGESFMYNNKRNQEINWWMLYKQQIVRSNDQTSTPVYCIQLINWSAWASYIFISSIKKKEMD
jgi:hypothetical protein